MLTSPFTSKYLMRLRPVTLYRLQSTVKQENKKPESIMKMPPSDRPLISKSLEYYKDESTHRAVKQRIKERLIALNSENIPQGVKFATCCLSLPLIASTLGLCVNLEQASTAAFFGRTCIRLLQLNISFLVSVILSQGGLHYGFAASNYEVSINSEDLQLIRSQTYFSFTPAVISYFATMPLLFQEPLGSATLVLSYSTLLGCQFLIFSANQYFKQKELAPLWLGRYSLLILVPTLLVNIFLFVMHFLKPGLIKRRNDPNRVSNLQTALELEDGDFLKMSNDLKLGYDNDELRDVEREALNQVNREQRKREVQKLREA